MGARFEATPHPLTIGVNSARRGAVAHVAGVAPGPVGVAAPTAGPVPLVEHPCGVGVYFWA